MEDIKDIKELIDFIRSNIDSNYKIKRCGSGEVKSKEVTIYNRLNTSNEFYTNLNNYEYSIELDLWDVDYTICNKNAFKLYEKLKDFVYNDYNKCYYVEYETLNFLDMQKDIDSKLFRINIAFKIIIIKK